MKRLILVGMAALILALVLWQLFAPRIYSSKTRQEITQIPPADHPGQAFVATNIVAADSVSRDQAVVSTAGAEAASVTPDAQVEIETVKFFIRDFRAALGENPVGNNAEITKALMGANPKQTRFVLPGDARVNAKGELVDHWGTPYFFHAISGKEMEIHSAGPDQRMWTGDDIVMR